MTDWTKDDDDKFFDWMDRDKQNHLTRQPKRNKTKSKKYIILGFVFTALVFLILVTISEKNEFSSENYFYIPDYRLNKSPVFCVQEFTDPTIPDASDIMLKKTFESVKDWETKIEQYTGIDGVWNFEYRTIPENSNFMDFGCDTTITYERFPSITRGLTRGETALSQYGFSDVVIFYLDLSSVNKIDPAVDMVIRHEIGHVLGLGHPIFNEMYDGMPIYTDGNLLFSRSIMVTPEIYPFLPSEIVYSITDYDVRSVVNLYGGGISDIPLFFGYLNYVIIGVILFGIAFFVNRNLKQR